MAKKRTYVTCFTVVMCFKMDSFKHVQKRGEHPSNPGFAKRWNSIHAVLSSCFGACLLWLFSLQGLVMCWDDLLRNGKCCSVPCWCQILVERFYLFSNAQSLVICLKVIVGEEKASFVTCNLFDDPTSITALPLISWKEIFGISALCNCFRAGQSSAHIREEGLFDNEQSTIFYDGS